MPYNILFVKSEFVTQPRGQPYKRVIGGLVEVEDVVEFIDGKRVPKTYNWFRLTTQKEWEEKSKKKKRKRKNS